MRKTIPLLFFTLIVNLSFALSAFAQCQGVLYMGAEATCEGIKINWLPRAPVATIDHFEIFRGPFKIGNAAAGAVSFVDPIGCSAASHYTIRQILKSGATCQTITSGDAPRSKPCDQCVKPLPGSIAVVNAVNYSPVTTPGSYVAAFTDADATNKIAMAPPGQLPLELAGVTADADGEAIPLVYVSPRQVNLFIPASIAPGQRTITIHGVRTFSGAINIIENAPVLRTFEGTDVAAAVYLPFGPLYALLFGTGVGVRIEGAVGVRTGQVFLILDDGRQFEAFYAGPSALPFATYQQYSFAFPPDFFDGGAHTARLRSCPDAGTCVDSQTVTLRRAP